MKKKVLSLILCATMMTGLLAGCGSGSTSETTATETATEETTQAESAEETEEASAEATEETTEAASDVADIGDEPITITILAGQSTTDTGTEDMITEAVAKVYPNITLEWECVSWNDLAPKMQQYMQSGLPDIIIGKGQDVATYAPLGVLGDLTGTPAVDRVLEDATAGVTVDGKVYGIVYNALYQGVYYNRALFEKYNVAIPTTQEELQQAIDTFNEAGITPFASHFVDGWSIGNVTMQFAINGVFNQYPTWGDDFREGKVSFESSEEYRKCYEYNKLIYDNTFEDTFSLEQTECDARMVNGEAAMKVSGAWSIQNFLDIDENFDFGIFPFPNETGDSKLIFEPNITFMKSANTEYSDAVDAIFNVIANDADLAVEILDYTKTASMIKDFAPTFNNPSQSDIEKYASEGMIVDANTGNTQLVWGGFQDENASDIAEWLLGNETLDEALQAADARRDISKP